MLGGIHPSRVFIVCGYTDMRRGIDGLSAIVNQNHKLDPSDGSLFLFCGRRSDRIKGLLWDDDGFLLLYRLRRVREFLCEEHRDIVPIACDIPAPVSSDIKIQSGNMNISMPCSISPEILSAAIEALKC